MQGKECELPRQGRRQGKEACGAVCRGCSAKRMETDGKKQGQQLDYGIIPAISLHDFLFFSLGPHPFKSHLIQLLGTI